MKILVFLGISTTFMITINIFSPIMKVLFSPGTLAFEQKISNEVNALIPLSIEMVESAIEELSNGLEGMIPESSELLNSIFDPADTGEIDQAYVEEMLKNYLIIRERLQGKILVEYVPNSETCDNMRLYYTDFRKIYVCPYFLEEESVERQARVLLHEVVHMALLVVDRPYYDPKSYCACYQELSPRPAQSSENPLVAHIIREIEHTDTLYSPDSYAWFAAISLVTPELPNG